MSKTEIISENKFKEIIDSSVKKAKFQKFIELITHAQTCPQCASSYNTALSVAENHMQEAHR